MEIDLARTIRFCISEDNTLALDAPRSNTYAAWPPMRGLGRYYELIVHCRGDVDEQTGYFMNIKTIDTHAREHGLVIIQQAIVEAWPIGRLMPALFNALQAALSGCVTEIRLVLSPTYQLRFEEKHMGQMRIAQRYDFSAAHRLHVSALSDEENREVFGKCNNPSGHGHNYQVEVVVSVPISADGQVCTIEQIDELVDEVLIERFDHKHLNVDVEEFQSLNPSTENMAKVFYDILAQQIGELGEGVSLHELSVWETEKTRATYQA